MAWDHTLEETAVEAAQGGREGSNRSCDMLNDEPVLVTAQGPQTE